MQIAIVCFDGVDELDAIGPYRVFAGAKSRGADLDVTLVSVDGAGSITTGNGVTIEVHGTLDGVDPDLIVVPGGGWNARSPQSAWAEAERGTIPTAIAAAYDRGTTIAGVCTGTMLLAEAGLLEGRPAVTHAGALDDLRDTDAVVRTDRVVDDGRIVTAGGVTSGIDLALHIVEREFGESVATAVSENLEYERQDGD